MEFSRSADVGCDSHTDTQLWVSAGLETFKRGNPPDSKPGLFTLKQSASNALMSTLSSFFSFPSQERFAELFGHDAAAEGRRSQESFKKWLLAGMTLVTGVVVGSLIAQKRL